jgi:hypothetical protein
MTILTKPRKRPHLNNKSQTNLLSEYFDKGAGDPRRPSVRVKVTPSSKSRSRSANDHIQITESKDKRKSSYTKRIQLGAGTKTPEEKDEGGISERGPVEVDIMPRNSSLLSADGMSSVPLYSFLDDNLPDPRELGSIPEYPFLDTDRDDGGKATAGPNE